MTSNEIEIVGAKESEAKALAIIQESELSSDEATSLKNALTPFFEQADEWVTKAKTLKVTDESQITEMTEARKARLALKDIRVNLEKRSMNPLNKILVINHEEVVGKLRNALTMFKNDEIEADQVIWLVFKLLTVSVRQEQPNGNTPSTGNSGPQSP